MGQYIPYTDAEREKMLRAIGLPDAEALYRDIPDEARIASLDLPAGMSELEVSEKVSGVAAKNRVYTSVFRGAGSYRHYIPAIVKTVTSKEEFLTAYTPYQAEISQGVLQSIFEYQTEMCELTGLDVSNASVYDGAVAAAEAVLMCEERKRSGVIVSGAIDPEKLAVIRTYCESRSVPVTVLPKKDLSTDPAALSECLTDTTASVYVESPNYYGIIEDMEEIVRAAHEKGAKLIMGVNPISLGLLRSPGELGADIAVGEGQPLGLPTAFGGPYLGFMTCRAEMVRKLPGRIVGETKDAEGRRAFVLTLQAREQHIRREKAGSNICSNEALCAMTAAVYLSAMGPGGLRLVAESSARNAHYLLSELQKIGFVRRSGKEFFHEFLTDYPENYGKIEKALEARGILGGLKTEEGILWCCTELNRKEKIDEMISVMKEVIA